MQGDLVDWAATQVVMTAHGHRLPGPATGMMGLSAPALTYITLRDDETAPQACVLLFPYYVSNLLVLCQ